MYQNDDYYMYHCEIEAQKMYPETYHKVYPYVKRKCETVDTEYNQMMNPFPNKETVEKMADEIQEEYNNDHPNEANPGKSHNLTRYDGYFGRDIITILLLRELLGRRRFRRRRRRFGGYGGYGGYGGFPFFGY